MEAPREVKGQPEWVMMKATDKERYYLLAEKKSRHSGWWG